jgi:hypothetical protein
MIRLLIHLKNTLSSLVVHIECGEEKRGAEINRILRVTMIFEMRERDMLCFKC